MSAGFAPAPARLFATAARRANAPAFFTRDDEGWHPTPWRDYADEVKRAARALVALGVQPGDVVCILGFNRPEWTVMDLAAMTVGAVAAGIYWTSAPDEVDYVLRHSASPLLLVENEAQWARLAGRATPPPALRQVVMMRGGSAPPEPLLGWDDFLALGDSRAHEAEVERRLAAIGPDDLGTLIYTSGTTGPPKAVMLTHGALSWTATAVCAAFGTDPDDRLISYLPLAHVAEQMLAIHTHVQAGYRLYFARSLDALADHLKEVRPTVFFGVPRVWEKMQAAIAAKLDAARGPKALLARWALRTGERWHAAVFAGRTPGAVLEAQRAVAHRLIHHKVQRALGFDAARILVSGAAPIAPETTRFFTGLGLAIGEVYGQSENCGPTSVALPGSIRPGSVGKPMEGVEVRIAEDGEILSRGPNLFAGYLHRPADTAEALEGGWLHTGDLGRFDDDGFLYVTGRKKDLLITSGGKNLSPANVEAELMNLALVEHAVVCGDRRHYLAALLTLDAAALAGFARQHALAGGPAEWRLDPAVRAELQRGIDAVNQRQARVAQVRRWALLDEPLTIAGGLLTPTLKIRRAAVLERHASAVDALYREEPVPPR